MKTELISVIVPVYNSEKYLDLCIKSILNQTYQNFELFLVNDGSTDNSSKICEAYQCMDKRICVINKENGGVSSARNVGLQNCTGSYISFIDSDDYVKEKYLEALLTNIKKMNVDMAACGYLYNTNKNCLKEKKFGDSRCIYTAQNRTNFCRNEFLYTVWGKLFKASLINQKRFDESISIGEDALFMANVIKEVKRIYFDQSCLYIYTHNQTSICHSANFSKREEEVRAWIKICKLQNKDSVAYQTARMQLFKTYRRIQAANWIDGEHDLIKLKKRRVIVKKNLKKILLVNDRAEQKLLLVLFWICPQLYFKIYKKKNISVY